MRASPPLSTGEKECDRLHDLVSEPLSKPSFLAVNQPCVKTTSVPAGDRRFRRSGAASAAPAPGRARRYRR